MKADQSHLESSTPRSPHLT